MKKSTRIWLIVGVIFLIVGFIVAMIGFGLGGSTSLIWTKKGVKIPSDIKRTELTDIALEDFTNMDLDISYYDVKFVASDKNALDIVYYSEDRKPEYRVENDTLVIDAGQSGSFGFFVFNQNHTNSMTVYYKQDAKLDQLQLKFRYGNVNLTQLSGKDLLLDTAYSDVQVKDNAFDSFAIKNDYGSYKVNNLTVQEELAISSSYCDYEFKQAVVGSLNHDSDYGEFHYKQFVVQNGAVFKDTYGDVEYEGDLFGKTEISADYSDFELDLDGREYSYKVDADYGDVSINDRDMSDHAESDSTTSNLIQAELSYGDFELDYTR